MRQLPGVLLRLANAHAAPACASNVALQVRLSTHRSCLHESKIWDHLVPSWFVAGRLVTKQDCGVSCCVHGIYTPTPSVLVPADIQALRAHASAQCCLHAGFSICLYIDPTAPHRCSTRGPALLSALLTLALHVTPLRTGRTPLVSLVVAVANCHSVLQGLHNCDTTLHFR